MELNEYTIIGSGVSGLIAAETLIDLGKKVTIIDIGNENKNILETDLKFEQYRKNEERQSELIIGKNFESLERTNRTNPIHLTPNKKYTVNRINGINEWFSDSFNPIESVAKGGLANAWGLGAYAFSKNEITEMGLNFDEIVKGYIWISKRYAISGGNDDAREYSNGNYFNPQKNVRLDFSGEKLMHNYYKRKKKIHQNNFSIGRTPLAICTEKTEFQESYLENDFDFYFEKNNASLRPSVIFEKLTKSHLFKYIPSTICNTFNETEDGIILNLINIHTHEKFICKTKKLLLSAGSIGTARIVMRSQQLRKLPIICNPYTYIPSIQLSLLGHSNTGYQTGLSQLALYYDKDNTHTQVALGSLYSYRSLMAFRLMKEFPIGYKHGLEFVKLIMPALNITGIFHPEYGSKEKFLYKHDYENSITNDKIECHYHLSKKELETISSNEKAYKKVLKILGTIPLKTIRNGNGASIHYGGTLPVNDSGEIGGVDKNGLLNGTKNIFVVDGSSFKFLPGKGITFTLMANAHNIATNATKQ